MAFTLTLYLCGNLQFYWLQNLFICISWLNQSWWWCLSRQRLARAFHTEIRATAYRWCDGDHKQKTNQTNSYKTAVDKLQSTLPQLSRYYGSALAGANSPASGWEIYTATFTASPLVWSTVGLQSNEQTGSNLEISSITAFPYGPALTHFKRHSLTARW